MYRTQYLMIGEEGREGHGINLTNRCRTGLAEYSEGGVKCSRFVDERCEGHSFQYVFIFAQYTYFD